MSEAYEEGLQAYETLTYRTPITEKLNSDMTGFWLLAKRVKLPTIKDVVCLDIEFFRVEDRPHDFILEYRKCLALGLSTLAYADKVIVRGYGAHVETISILKGTLVGIFKISVVVGGEEVELHTVKSMNIYMDTSIYPFAIIPNFKVEMKPTMNSFEVDSIVHREWRGNAFESPDDEAPKKQGGRLSSVKNMLLGKPL